MLPAVEKPVVFTTHARRRMAERGATEKEVRRAILRGRADPARSGPRLHRIVYPFDRAWAGRWFDRRQVAPQVVEDEERFLVRTVYVFYS